MTKLFLSILLLLLLLAGCIIAGVIRKAFGGTFLPPPGSDGDHHVRDHKGKWWRYNAKDGRWEEAFWKPAEGSDVVLVDRNGIAVKVKQDGGWSRQNLSKKNHRPR
jgi:hypothetical protein